MCGNFGFLGKRVSEDEQELLPARVVEAFQQMGRETEIRGEQAGGGLTLARDKNNQIKFVGKKVLNQKRDNLTQSLEDAFDLVRREAVFGGMKPLESVVAGVWHYRYGTSSPPSILETHWHEWMPAREAIVWQLENRGWVRSTKHINHRITHNGDFDTFRPFDEPIDNSKLGWWLERVLQTANSTIGDSPKIAGLMDLLITQGMWDASLRLAYQLEVAESIEAAFGGRKPAKNAANTAPSQQELDRWAEIYEKIWQEHQDAEISTSKESIRRFKAQALEVSKNILPNQCSRKKQVAFVRAAIDAFLHNDLYQATRIFMSRAEGSFGLVTASTLNEESLVLSSQGQPMSIGFNLPEAYMVYASEPAAVNAVLVGMPQSHRLDLDQKAGEVALVGTNNITVYSMAENRELLKSELEARSMPMQKNPYIQLPKVETQDPVASDIQEIPQVLKAIEASWLNPKSCNRQSAEHLLSLLVDKVQHFDERREKTIKAGLIGELGKLQTVDVLIAGIENSLWVGERFAQDLETVFPLLNVRTLSANQTLRQAQYNLQSLNLGEDSIVLAISQSGQTFPTLHTTHILNKLYQEEAIGGLFILTGELNSPMGAAIAQSYVKGAAFSRRIFTSGSGKRTAEPATLTAAAAHETLTELLFYLANRIRQVFPDSSPLGMTLTEESLAILNTIKADFLDRSVVLITGMNARGVRINAPENRKLIRQGCRWALHVTEAPIAWGIHALYVSIVLGWLIPFGYVIPVTQTMLRLILLGLFLPQGAVSQLLALLYPVLTLADIGIAIFGPWLWTIGLRYFQRRQLLSRTGRRTLVIGDVPWVHQLLESYISKLFSLSYGITALDVHSANPQDHMLHQFGHRVVRGTLLLLGVPDGRRSLIQKSDEDAAIMTGKQVNGVRNTRTGPEVIALGHNPAIAHKGFSQAIVLRNRTNSLLEGKVPLDQQAVIEELTETRFSSFERLLASYVLFWAFAQKVASFPLLKYQHWKSQSRTRVATTAAPVSGMSLLSSSIAKTTSVNEEHPTDVETIRSSALPDLR